MIGLVAAVLSVCVLTLPVEGEVTSDFSPGPGYGGHWGIDVGADPGSVVSAPLSGEVGFAGAVAGMRTISIVDGRLRVSVSFLTEVRVIPGQRVIVGEPIGLSGRAHGGRAVHLSVRIDGRYVDPAPLLLCSFDLSRGLRLVRVRPS